MASKDRAEQVHPPLVSAVVVSFNRPDHLRLVLDRLVRLPVDEILVVDNASSDDLPGFLELYGPKVRLLQPGSNLGASARNLAAEQARGRFLLNLDDDSFPRLGAIERCLQAFECAPRLGIVGGVRDVDEEGRLLKLDEVGIFDWFLRGGRKQAPPASGFPAFFFPAGASMARRDVYLEVGGFLGPLFINNIEIELTTRLLGSGWEVTYLPTTVFNHAKAPTGVTRDRSMAKYRVRNQLWYFWLHFPPKLAARRIVAYLLFDLIEYAYRRNLSAWLQGVLEAWRDRESVRQYRKPLPRQILRRAELNRGRLHVRLLREQLLCRVMPGRRRKRNICAAPST